MSRAYYQYNALYFVKTESAYIIANTADGDYYMFSGPQSAVFQLLQDHADASPRGVAHVPYETAEPLIASLADDGSSLFPRANGSLEVRRHDIGPLQSSLLSIWPDNRTPHFLKCAIAFFLAFALSALCRAALSTRSAATVISFLRRCRPARGASKLTDEIYRHHFIALRRFFYTSQNECYFDSMVATLYFILLGRRSRWIFGVMLPPFKAHCWVEIEGTLANDQIVRTAPYTPIFAI